MGDEGMDVKEYDLISRISEDVSELKKNDKSQDERLHKLEINDRLQDRDIQGTKETLEKIEENTAWLRRTVAKTLITGSITAGFALIGGLMLYILTHK